MLTEGISTPISRHNKVTDAVWRSQMSSLLQLKWDPADRYQYFKKRNPCSLLELGFKPSDKPHRHTSLFLTLSDVADQAGGSLTRPKEPMSPAARSCPGTAPAAVPTEVFVQLRDEKQQGTNPATEWSAERTWGEEGLKLTPFCSNPARAARKLHLAPLPSCELNPRPRWGSFLSSSQRALSAECQISLKTSHHPKF